MRNFTVRVLLLLFVAAPFAGQTGEWKRYSNTNGNFSALFPGEPKDTLNGSAEGVESHTLAVVVQPLGYTVVYDAMAKEQPVDDATFAAFKDAVFKELPTCSVVRDDVASLPIPGYIGRWYTLSCDSASKKVAMAGNLYWGRHYAYAVMALSSEAMDPASLKKFTGSFSVIDASK